MISWSILILGACLSLASLLSSILGIGGGTLYTPIQILFGMGVRESAAMSLFLTMALSISSLPVYRAAKKIDWGMAMAFEAFAIVGAVAGGYMSDYVEPIHLTNILIVVLVLTSLNMIFNKRQAFFCPRQSYRWYVWHRETCGLSYDVNMAVAAPICLVAGFISGLTGIGGGVMKVPMMTLMLGVPIDIAIATSSLMVGITAAGGFVGHVAVNNMIWKYALVFVPFVLVCAQFGARVMLRTRRETLRRVFGLFLLVAAAGLVIKAVLTKMH
jgi:uncharacterized membrane protein YfcA